MTRLPAAKQSPRVSAGTLYWYAADTFRLLMQLALSDQDGEQIRLNSEDSVMVRFYDQTCQLVYSVSPAVLEDNQVELVFDATVSALFTEGEYHYDVCCVHGERVTLIRGNRAVVE